MARPQSHREARVELLLEEMLGTLRSINYQHLVWLNRWNERRLEQLQRRMVRLEQRLLALELHDPLGARRVTAGSFTGGDSRVGESGHVVQTSAGAV